LEFLGAIRILERISGSRSNSRSSIGGPYTIEGNVQVCKIELKLAICCTVW
jgi:hypothetical protein